jgi:hypothetical protein
MFGLGSSATLMYYLLTGLTFWVISEDVLFRVPSLGPIPQSVVKALVFVTVHILVHQLKRSLK